jgi:glycosyltransferase involved in cell wall biosynthesis
VITRRKALVLNHFALPRSIGGGTRHVELFSRLGDGWDWLIVASDRNNYTRQKYTSDDPRFVTVPTPEYSSNGLGRVANWAAYVLGACLVGIRTRSVGVVYGSSPHLLAPLAAWGLARVRRAAFVLEVRDLWPRSMVELGYLAEGSRLHRILVGVERFLYRHADAIVVTSPGYVRHIETFGVSASKVTVVSNGADPSDFEPTVSKVEARARLGLPANGFVAIYAGAHGPANGLDQVLDAAAKLTHCTFLLVGDGLEKQRLVARARDEGLSNVGFCDAVPKSELADLLVAADIGLHVLTDTKLFHEGISANKLYDYMACGLPAITNVRGESAEAVSGARAGIACRPDGVAEAVEQLSAVPARQRRAMGERGRAFVQAHKSRTAMAGRLRELLEEVVK